MAEESYLMIFFFVIVIFFAVNESSVNGGRMQLKNQIKEMNLFTYASTYTKKDSGRKRNLIGENGEVIRLPIQAGKEGNFLVTVGFGTPAKDLNLLFDTGSDVTWICCQPCSSKFNCDPQISVFDPSSSSTIFACNHPDCKYSSYYNDGSSITGYFVKDTITLDSYQSPDFIFACAQQINGKFEGASSGLLGLGVGTHSLVAEINSPLLNSFCYCLPASNASLGYFMMGVQAYKTCQAKGEKFIPIAPVSHGHLGYYVSLTGISIGGSRIDVPSIGFSYSSSIRAMVDSGTVISRLPNPIYLALKSEFQKIMSDFNTSQSPTPDLIDTCYNLEMPISDWIPPVIVLHFDDVDVELDSSAATIMGNHESEICLAFSGNKGNNDLIIIGNQQHQNRDLFFDMYYKRLYFSSGPCMYI